MKKITPATLSKILLFSLVDLPLIILENFKWPYWKSPPRTLVSQALFRMKKQRLVEIGEEGEKTIIKITEDGKKRVLKYKLKELSIKKPKRWDGNFRLVIFDIPDKKRLARDVLRMKLKELGFYQFQESVFVYPYECKDEIDFIKELYEISPFVKYIVAENIDDSENLLKYFNL